MALFDFLKKKDIKDINVLPQDTSVKTGVSTPAVTPAPKPPMWDWSFLNKDYGFGRVLNLYDRSNTSYHTNSYLRSEGARSYEFDLDINLYRLWRPTRQPDICSGLGYFDTYNNLYKITLNDPGLKGINETDIYSCSAKFILESNPSGGFSVTFTGIITAERKPIHPRYLRGRGPAYNNNGIKRGPVSFIQLGVNRKSYQISDSSQLNNVFESTADVIRDEIENDFRLESIGFKSDVYKQYITKEYNEQVNNESIRDVFSHVIDLLGEPSLALSSTGCKMDFVVSRNSNNQTRLDSKMTDVLFEISEATNRIKSLHNKTTVDISIGGGCLSLMILPDVTINENGEEWINFDPTTFNVGPTLSTSSNNHGTASNVRIYDTSGSTHSQYLAENLIAESLTLDMNDVESDIDFWDAE